MESVPEGVSSISALLLQSELSVQNITVLILLIVVLLLLTAITAGAETAYFSLKAKDINILKTSDNKSYKQALHLLDNPRMLLASILVTNNFVNIAIVITTNLVVSNIMANLGLSQNVVLSFLIQILAVTFLLVLFGEVLPKVYATQNNLRMAIFSAPFLAVMLKVFRPVSRVLVSSTNFIEKRLNNQKGNNISSEDFEHAIELTVGHSATKEEVNIFKGILKFGNISVRQIMRTRHDVAGIPYEYTFPQVQQYAIEAGYSRMPVYHDTLDKIAGMIHTKDFIPHTDDDDFDWHTLIRPSYFVHEGKMIEDLLAEFQHKRMHLAIVVDEFGGTSGIVTLEDIMEEIIGDIRDEFDDDDISFKKIDDNNFIFEGKTLINDACRLTGIPPEELEKVRGESDSLAGLVLEINGKFPSINETIFWSRFTFLVLEIEKMRIKKIKLTISEVSEENEEED